MSGMQRRLLGISPGMCLSVMCAFELTHACATPLPTMTPKERVVFDSLTAVFDALPDSGGAFVGMSRLHCLTRRAGRELGHERLEELEKAAETSARSRRSRHQEEMINAQLPLNIPVPLADEDCLGTDARWYAWLRARAARSTH